MRETYDVIIIGAGPAGLTAAIYASRADLRVLIIEAGVNGGKLSKIHEIENYPGISRISGLDLAMQLSQHGQQFGAELISGEVHGIDKENGNKIIRLTDGRAYEARAVIVATGTRERILDLPHAEEYTGRGISYCAVCDGFFYRNKEVIVIGGGNSALAEALYLASLASRVTIILRRDVFRAEAGIVDKVKANEKIRIITKHIPKELVLDGDRISGLKIEDTENRTEQIIPCSGIFPYIGADPCTSFLDRQLLDEHGYVITNPDLSTAVKGIYAAGDCIVKNLRQVVTACSDGAIAASSVNTYLMNQKN